MRAMDTLPDEAPPRNPQEEDALTHLVNVLRGRDREAIVVGYAVCMMVDKGGIPWAQVNLASAYALDLTLGAPDFQDFCAEVRELREAAERPGARFTKGGMDFHNRARLH